MRLKRVAVHTASCSVNLFIKLSGGVIAVAGIRFDHTVGFSTFLIGFCIQLLMDIHRRTAHAAHTNGAGRLQIRCLLGIDRICCKSTK